MSDARRVLVGRVLVVIGMLLAGPPLVAAFLVPFSPVTLDLFLIAVSVVATVGGFLVVLRPLPLLLRNPLGPEERPAPVADFGLVGALVLGGLIAPLPLFQVGTLLLDFPPNHRDEFGVVVNAAPVGALLAVPEILLMALGVWLGGRRAGAVYARLLDAVPLGPSLPPGTWAWGVGVVRDPSPVAVGAEPAACAITTDEEVLPGSDPNIVVRSFANVGTFVVDVGRSPIEVDPRGLYWSGPSRRELRGVAASGNKRVLTTEYLAVGAPVFVAGRVRRGPRGGVCFAADADPVVVMRIEPGSNPLPGIRAVLRRRRIGLAVLLVLALVGVGSAVTGLAVLPPIHFPPGDSSE